MIPRFAIVDPFLEQMAIATATALRERREDGLYIDSLAQMMAVHLATTHSSRAIAKRHAASAASLPSWKMRRLMEFIEANLDGDLSLERMAGEVDISPLYLPRAFKSAFGQSPHQYVLSRRIEHAKNLLRNTSEPVVDIAFACGFSSQSHLVQLVRPHGGPVARRLSQAGIDKTTRAASSRITKCMRDLLLTTAKLSPESQFCSR